MDNEVQKASAGRGVGIASKRIDTSNLQEQ